MVSKVLSRERNRKTTDIENAPNKTTAPMAEDFVEFELATGNTAAMEDGAMEPSCMD